MYSNCIVHLEVGKERRQVQYTTGVQQGDNVAPILFLFLIQAAFKSLEKKLTYKHFEFRYFPDNTKNPQKQNGHLLSQETSSLGKTFNINCALYVNDGVSLFSTCEETEQAAQFMHDHMKCFGLQIHVRSGKQKSKMEAMFFPTTLRKQRNKMQWTGYHAEQQYQ